MDLTEFINKHDINPYARQIIDIGGSLGVCDGHMLLLDESTKGKHYGFLDFHKERRKAYPNYTMDLKLEAIEGEFNDLPWMNTPTLKQGDYKECHACDSRGMVANRSVGCAECNNDGVVSFENDCNAYEVCCKSCDGDGNAFSGGIKRCSQCKGTKQHLNFVPIFPVNDKWGLNGAYIEKLKTLKNIQYAWHHTFEFFVFRFAGGYGVIMPMRL